MIDDPTEADGKRRGPDDVGVADGHSTVGTVWQEGAPGHCVIKLRDLRASPPQAQAEVTVGNASGNNHSPSIGDHKSGGGRVSAINVAWVESSAGDASGAGRIMWQSFRSGEPLDAANVSPAANDNNATWVTGPHGFGAIGHEPTIAGLEGGNTLVAWIGIDGNAHGRMYAPGDADAADAPHYASVNAALGDLGPAVAGGDGGRRLQVAEPRPGTFAVMWLALADSGLALRGSLFLGPANSGPTEDRGLWTEKPIADIRLPPGSTGAFSLTGTGAESADLLVTYPVLDAATGGVRVLGRHIDGTGDGRGQSTPEFLLSTAALQDDPSSALAHAAVHHGTEVRANAPDSGPPANALMLAEHEGGNHRALALTIAAEPGVDERAPIVKAVDDGFVVAWETPGASEGTVQIKLAIYDAHGAPKVLADGGTVVRVTDSAAAGVAPAISGLGSGAVVAFVGAGDGGLTVKAYDGAGEQIGKETVVDSGGAGAISELAIDTQAVKGEDGTVQEQVAVVYVRDSADTDAGNDYGTIYLQRYAVAVNDGQPQQLVELGLDGTNDGADGPAQITTETDGDPATSEAVYGRAPVVEALDGGGLAVAWVEGQDAIETIKGRVLAPDGSQVLRIDLTDLIGDQGIARSTKPILLDTADGDILVNWLQPDGDADGYVVMSARYEADAAGGWIMPDQPIRLQEFDDEPAGFAVTLSEGDATFLTVTWQSDSSGSGSGNILSQRYDIDGHDAGGTMTVGSGAALQGEQQTASEAFSTAGLADGKIVIVYTEQSGDGSVDLAAHVVEAPGVAPAAGNAGDVASVSAGPSLMADTFEFAPGYTDGAVHHEVIDMTYSGLTTYQQLVDSGALVQAGDDVVVALNPADPADPNNVTLKGADLSVLTDDYFKFS